MNREEELNRFREEGFSLVVECFSREDYQGFVEDIGEKAKVFLERHKDSEYELYEAGIKGIIAGLSFRLHYALQEEEK
jgi:hypothetical protein